MKALIFLVCLLMFIICNSCGKSFDLRSPKIDQSRAPNLQVSVKYEQRSADILILRDKQLPDQSFGNRNGNDTSFASKLSAASGPLAARLKWISSDAHVAFVEVSDGSGTADSQDESASNYGQLLDTDGPAVIKSDTPDLAKLIAKRISPEAGTSSYYGRSGQPLATLAKTLSSKTESTSTFFRTGTRLSILFLIADPAAEEEISAEEITETLNAKYGAGNWTVSAAFNESTPCSPVNVNAVIAPPYTEDELKKSRNRPGQGIRQLVAASNGIMLSTCATSISPFLSTVALMAVGPQHVPVELGKKVMWDSIDVKFEGKSLQGWRYDVGSTVLQIPTTVPSGAKISITYEEDHNQRANVAESNGGLYEIPVPDDERDFYANVSSILSTYCSECHSTGGAQTAFVDNFNTIKNMKAKIQDRINRPESDPLHMPKTGSSQLSAPTLKSLSEWLGK